MKQAGIKMEDTAFIKYHKIPYLDIVPEILDNEVSVFEKLDGGNCHFRKINGRLRCSNRANFIEGKGFERFWFPAFRKWALSNYSLYDIDENHVFYGEWLAKHNIDYEKEHMNKFYLLDAIDLKSGKFLDYDEAKQLVKEYALEGINFLRTLAQGRLKKEDLEKLIEKSDYYSGPKEGVVIKNYKNQVFAKQLHKDFADDREKISRGEISDYRIVKAIMLLEDTGTVPNKERVVEILYQDINEELGLKINKKKTEKRIEEFIFTKASKDLGKLIL